MAFSFTHQKKEKERVAHSIKHAAQVVCVPGEQLVSPRRVLFGDEISNGLDTGTTTQIIKWMRDMCHTQQDTMLIALLQPAPEVWELFDDVLLLAEGVRIAERAYM